MVVCVGRYFIHVLRFVDGVIFKIPSKVYPDGSYFDGTDSFYPETEEWKIKYQNSLSLRVLQTECPVYFVMPVKRGKVNTRALVMDIAGAFYHTYVSTFPEPKVGQCFNKLRMDLEVVSLVPIQDLYEKVLKALDET
jgi:hypothetical protein